MLPPIHTSISTVKSSKTGELLQIIFYLSELSASNMGRYVLAAKVLAAFLLPADTGGNSLLPNFSSHWKLQDTNIIIGNASLDVIIYIHLPVIEVIVEVFSVTERKDNSQESVYNRCPEFEARLSKWHISSSHKHEANFTKQL